MMTFALEQSATGGWNVSRCRTVLFRDLQLGAAIQLAKTVARDEHHRRGCPVRVEMPGPAGAIELARYAADGDDGSGAKLVAVSPCRFVLDRGVDTEMSGIRNPLAGSRG